MAAKGLPIATTGGLIIGENSVLVVETNLNERLNIPAAYNDLK
jgi:hypothetical protein